MRKNKRELFEKTVDDEILRKGKNVIKDFDDSAKIFIPAKKRESKLISLRLPMTMIKELRQVAIQKGDIGYQQVLKSYIADGLSREKQIGINYGLIIQRQGYFTAYVTSGSLSGPLLPEERRSLSTQLIKNSIRLKRR